MFAVLNVIIGCGGDIVNQQRIRNGFVMIVEVSKMNKTFLLLIGIFLISFASATITCNPPIITTSYLQGDTAQVGTICSNTGEDTVTISYSGETEYFDIGGETVIGPAPSSKTIDINFFSIAPLGFHAGSLDFSTGESFPISFYVEGVVIEQGDILVFPTSKIVTVKQGNEKTQNIQITVPETYPRVVTMQSVDLNPTVETIYFGDLNLGQVSPGNSINIPIVFDGIEAQTGTYQTTLTIFATDSEGQVNIPSINLQLHVTAGVSPDIGDIFSTKPSCSLSGTTFNLNSTATFTCSGVVQNLEVNPQYNEYLEGTSIDLSSGIYTYTFKPIKYGVTKFIAIFTYKGSPIFSAYESEIKINPSGTNIAGGTELKVEFYQVGDKKTIDNLREGETKILVLDNVSNSMVNMEEVDLYLNGDEVNSTFSISLDEEYELRVSALNLGYIDLVLNFNVTEVPIEITLSPLKVTYNINDIINITTNPENASLLLDNVIITSPYTVTLSGTFLLEAKKENYLNGEINITVKSMISCKIGCDSFYEAKKGKNVLLDLSENITWNVTFEKLYKNDTYSPEMVLASGTGNRIQFKIEDYGRYVIREGDNIIDSKIILREGAWNWIKNNWGWGIVILVVLILIVYLIFFKGKKEEEGFGFTGQAPTEGG